MVNVYTVYAVTTLPLGVVYTVQYKNRSNATVINMTLVFNQNQSDEIDCVHF